MSGNTWPFTRSSPGVGGERRLACRVSGVDGLDDRTSVLSRPGSSSRGPRTVNDPYTPSPCCETNGPPRFLFLSLWRLSNDWHHAVPRPSRIGSDRETSRAKAPSRRTVRGEPHNGDRFGRLVLQLRVDDGDVTPFWTTRGSR